MPKKKKSKGKGKGKNKEKEKIEFNVMDIKVTRPETQVGRNGKHDGMSLEALGISLKMLSHGLAERSDYGSLGRKIDLLVNYFPVEFPRGHSIYHYHVDITLKKGSLETSAEEATEFQKGNFVRNTSKKWEIIGKALREHSNFDDYVLAYDGRENLYTRKPLEAVPLEVLVEMSVSHSVTSAADHLLSRGPIFHVSIKPVVKRRTQNCGTYLDMLHALYERIIKEEPLGAITTIGTILRNRPNLQHISVGRSFFYPPRGPEDFLPLSGGKEMWFGYHQSFILTEQQPVIKINLSTTAFWKSEQLIVHVCEVLGCSKKDIVRISEFRDSDIVLLSKTLKGLKVKVTHITPQREYRVSKFTRESAKVLSFIMHTTEGHKGIISVRDYFSATYNIQLQYPNLPCVQLQPEAKKIYMPLEVCEIVQGQPASKRLSSAQACNMKRFACMSPQKRFSEIQKVSHMQFDKHFGISVSQRPLDVEGRVIEPPNVIYCDQRRVRPKDGSWEMKSEKFYRSAMVNAWIILSFVNERFCTNSDLARFADQLRRTGQDFGLMLGNLECIEIFGNRNLQMAHLLKTTQQRHKDVKFAVVVLENKGSPLYAEIKQISEIMFGLTTQCVLAPNVTRLKPSVIKNICLKINVKMGGINCSLTIPEIPAVFRRPIIIIGAKCTPRSVSAPSVSAVVGSLDACPARYVVALRTQVFDSQFSGSDIIWDLRQMIVNLLKDFFRETKGKKPEKIIFYRSGIGESQFVAVQNFEVSAIRNACRCLDADYNPGITFIVVQKRHQTRFIPRNPRDGVGPKRNIPPGTVVDRGVSRIGHFDFFLCSHLGHEGTSRPTHYTVICDDNKLTSDDIQKLTYHLCHTYARCTRSISVPAPLAYANLAACHATKRLSHCLNEHSVSEMSDTEVRILQSSWIQKNIVVMPEIRKKMCFV